ncbi:hypothetical protein OG216_45900 (plasmid) [Streptomycetaceae bacterium NBC_01309]
MYTRHEVNALRSLDGRYWVTVTLHRARSRDCYRVTEIAHELGYRLRNVFTTRSYAYLDFVTDESPTAQARAAKTAAYVAAGRPVTTALPGMPGGPNSYDAARARFHVAGERPQAANATCVCWSALASLALLVAGILTADAYAPSNLGVAAGVASLVIIIWVVFLRAHSVRSHDRLRSLIETYDCGTPAAPSSPGGSAAGRRG